MTKIKNTVAYVIKTPLALTDYAIGTNSEDNGVGMAKGQSISMQMTDIRNVVIAGLSPEIGGTLKITELAYEGVLTSPADVANNLDPVYIVSPYEVLMFNVNGNKYLLKLQDVTIGDGEPNIADSDFITIVGFEKLGTGTNVLKGYNVATGKHEFYAIKSTGLDVSIVTGDVVIERKAGTKLGDGVEVYKGLNPTTKLDEFYALKSNSLNITKEIASLVETGNILIEIPSTSDTPRFYVNSGYDIGGTAPENGSPSKPYKTIASAKTAFIGTGTAQSPEFSGAEIIIQKGVGYTFTGDFNMSGATIILEENTVVVSAPASGDWLCDFDALSATTTAILNIVVNNNATLILNKSGFRNKGTSVNNNAYTDSKIINFSGGGTIYCDHDDTSTISYTILESNFTTNNTFNNDSNSNFVLNNVVLKSLTQQIYKVGGNANIVISGSTLESGTLSSANNINLIAFNQIGGIVVKYNCNIFAGGTSTRTVLYNLNKSSGIICNLIIQNPLIQGKMVTLFNNESSLLSVLQSTNLKTAFFTCTNIAKSPSVLWTTAEIFNSITETGVIDTTQVDLTSANNISCYNIFSKRVVENLQIFGSRALAFSGGLRKGSKFINRKTITAGSFVVGVEYQILTVGTTDYTLIGADSNTVGVYFTASGVGTGTGTAYEYNIDILI